ncbi:hypothetical protein MLD38_034612 [Melastoma candidum]|uniref:Uncharacterized protein n=1 Tax=Melastoma candidum TaxID=119954 RepID=A0ACB9MEH7_9MYRT|nr:hypothetical protein MLD38_034612 [Melastoma candidum]
MNAQYKAQRDGFPQTSHDPPRPHLLDHHAGGDESRGSSKRESLSPLLLASGLHDLPCHRPQAPRWEMQLLPRSAWLYASHCRRQETEVPVRGEYKLFAGCFYQQTDRVIFSLSVSPDVANTRVL